MGGGDCEGRKLLSHRDPTLDFKRAKVCVFGVGGEGERKKSKFAAGLKKVSTQSGKWFWMKKREKGEKVSGLGKQTQSGRSRQNGGGNILKK